MAKAVVCVTVRNFEGLPESVFVSRSLDRCNADLAQWNRRHLTAGEGSVVFTVEMEGGRVRKERL